ncbi:hypothetical protein HKW98_12450 [Stutzerimonas urumqiensis]|uniref:hypothetical protein n=1 Tax=Stutzerimonas urumqiensis TaxID=638269 RepID=UPI003BABA572
MLIRSLTIIATVLALQGCGVSMPRYEPSFDNVQTLKANAPMSALQVPSVTAEPGQDSIFVRANPIHSPAGSISQHVQQALESELRLAGLLDEAAQKRLDVRLEQADLEAGVGAGNGAITANFDLHDGERSLYSSSKTVQSQWNSSFVGVVAIPAAANAFNPLVRKLLAALYEDPAFIKAMKR